MSLSLTTSEQIPVTVSQRLAALRRRIIVWFLVDGLARVLLLALGLVAVDLVLDRFFRMDVPQRGIMLALMAAALAGMFYWRLVLPFAKMPGDDALCLSVEDRHKELGQSLISAVQFSRQKDYESKGVSATLVRATIESGVQAASRLDFTDVLDSGKYWLNVVLLCGSVFLTAALGVGVVKTQLLATWFNRNIILGDRVWPQNTYLEVQNVKNGKIRLPRGENWTQTVVVTPDSKEIPKEGIFVDFRPMRGRPPQKMKKIGDRSFEIVFNNVIEEFSFRARGGDAATPWVRVELVEPPAVADLSLVVTPPAYAGDKIEQLSAGKGPYYVLKGSKLTLSGVANKSLREAELLLPQEKSESTSPGDKKSEPPRVSLELQDKTKFTANLAPEQIKAGTYTIVLTDEEGLQSKHPTTFGLRIKVDREPRVRAKLVGISGMVVPQAMIPIATRVSDDFRVMNARLAFSWRGDEGESQPHPGTLEFEQLKERLPAADLFFDDVFDLPPHKIPAGTSLSFRLEAEDNDNISGPNTGRSPEFLLKVVTEEQLRTDLLRREKEQRQEFERLLKTQEDLATETRALAAGVAGVAELTEEQKLLVMGISRRQKLVGTNTATIANRLNEFLDEVHNNRLEEEGGPLERRLRDRIIDPMIEIAKDNVPEAMRTLDKARRLAGTAAERDPALNEAVAQQEALAAKMREILVHMVKAEGYQEAVNLLYEIEKSQKGVYDLTLKEIQDRIKRIFEEGGDVKPAPEPEGKKPDDKKPPEDKSAPCEKPQE